LLQGLANEEDARILYQAAAEAGLAQAQPPSPEDHLTAAMQEQEQKLRVIFSFTPLLLFDLSTGSAASGCLSLTCISSLHLSASGFLLWKRNYHLLCICIMSM